MPIYTRKKLKSLRELKAKQDTVNCLICLSDSSLSAEKGILPCTHNNFCFTCILDWSRITNQCPLCKFRFCRIKNESTGEIIITENKDQTIDQDFFFIETKCSVCDRFDEEDTMLLCDRCNKGFHTSCLGMNGIPDVFEWYCDECLTHMSGYRARLVIKAMIKVGRILPKERKRLKKLKVLNS